MPELGSNLCIFESFMPAGEGCFNRLWSCLDLTDPSVSTKSSAIVFLSILLSLEGLVTPRLAKIRRTRTNGQRLFEGRVNGHH